MAIFLCHSLEKHSPATSSPFLSTRIYIPYCWCGFDGSVDSSTTQFSITESCPSFIDELQSLRPSPLPDPRKKRMVNRTTQVSDNYASNNIAILSTASSKNSKRKRCFSAGSVVNAFNSPASPDRFIPGRDSFDATASPLRLNKFPHHLSPEEKLLRRRDTSADPFRPRPPRRTVSVPRPIDQRRRRQNPYSVPHLVTDPTISGDDGFSGADNYRQVSVSSVWNVGGPSAATGSPRPGIPDGMGSLLGSGTTAPLYVVNFQKKITPTEEHKIHESRLALALDVDLANRLLNIPKIPAQLDTKLNPTSPLYERYSPLTWKDNAWKRAEGVARPKTGSRVTQRAVPLTPFRVLDAPLLRDDFYCTTLAYSYTSKHLAVGLSSTVYLWSEARGVQCPPFHGQPPSNYVTSLSFSSMQGGRSILAVGRHDGQVSLWSTFDSEVRFEISQPHPISCVAFKETTSHRQSELFTNIEVDVEDLAVGDDLGNIWYYSVEWPDIASGEFHRWNGAMILLAKISAHTQQICGLAWSPDGSYLATGGNDNSCLLFDLRELLIPERVVRLCKSPAISYRLFHGLQSPRAFSRRAVHTRLRRLFSRHPRLNQFLLPWTSENIRSLSISVMSHTGLVFSGSKRTAFIPLNSHKFRLNHSAAVKAIAFAPWQPSLLATGGGSNDRSIHFYHTASGTCLATIDVHAQVTSLIWSKTRREIAATFGYAQPEHSFRIAVFEWPSCQQVVAIPWNLSTDDGLMAEHSGRALWAISYPGGPNEFASSASRNRETSDIGISNIALSTAAGSRIATPTPSSESNDIQRYSVARRYPPSHDREGGIWWPRTVEEGCIIVASSDGSVRFHEVWSGTKKNTLQASGLLGGSDILEGLEGIEKEGREIIR